MNELDWINWWCCTWRWAHPGWRLQLLAAHGLDTGHASALAGSRHAELLEALGVMPSQPPPVDADVALWLSLTAEQREQALLLARSICCAPFPHQPTVAERHGQWCRSLAKALRPGLWLDQPTVDARVLLASWLGAPFWSRLRLAWAPGESLEPLADLPRQKLDTLWRAVLWRVATP
ncbi:type III secretion protein [Pseudomonas gingeri]|uniref:type III secretion protein n=1 Tax=Pseudomonas gingeri TaxID=117681 RepID=UPI0015A1FFEC|nr:type III secretion protein [Pseudomonas gingeri]NWA02076.1 type III secretion protein [Pseudomonas gingeri]NWA18131.1 type III secretion protein [Pseudomonas gingeri]NWA56288.1 type III secretion protein [Pseudomonas gingeri]NWA98866.1 type III secretion protein [Pseudomonas gingeri]NWB04815.1 type III secretion protein [Pseudomonas gingeri]